MSHARLASPLLALLLTTFAAAQTSRPVDSPATAEVRAAAKSFVEALLGDDLFAMARLFRGDEENLYMLENVWALHQSRKKLARAIEKRWPGEKVDSSVAESLRRSVQETSVIVRGDRAALLGWMRLRRDGGQWWVIDYGTEGDKQLADTFAAMSDAYDATSAAIDAGQHATRAEADAAMQKRLSQAMIRKSAATRPAR